MFFFLFILLMGDQKDCKHVLVLYEESDTQPGHSFILQLKKKKKTVKRNMNENENNFTGQLFWCRK